MPKITDFHCAKGFTKNCGSHCVHICNDGTKLHCAHLRVTIEIEHDIIPDNKVAVAQQKEPGTPETWVQIPPATINNK